MPVNMIADIKVMAGPKTWISSAANRGWGGLIKSADLGDTRNVGLVQTFL